MLSKDSFNDFLVASVIADLFDEDKAVLAALEEELADAEEARDWAEIDLQESRQAWLGEEEEKDDDPPPAAANPRPGPQGPGRAAPPLLEPTGRDAGPALCGEHHGCCEF